MKKIIDLKICFIISGFCFFAFSAFAADENAAKSDSYEELVQRNLEFRSQLKEMEKKYEDIENERQVLILHIKKMQKEKEILVKEANKTPQEVQAIKAMRMEIESLRKKLDEMAKERDKYKQGYTSLKNTYGSKDGNLKKTLDRTSELERQVKVLKGETRKCLSQMIRDKDDFNRKGKTLDESIRKAVEEEKTICKGKLANRDDVVCSKEQAKFEREKVQIEGKVGKEIEQEKKNLQQENEKLKQLLRDKEKKLDDAMAGVLEEKESFKKELRDILSKVNISSDQLQNLKNRAFISETEAKMLKDRLREQSQLRAKLESDIITLRKEKLKAQEDADKYADDEIEKERAAAQEKVAEVKEQIDKRVNQLVELEKKRTEGKIKEIEFKASKELKTALAFEKQTSKKKMKEFKEKTEKSLKKAVVIERKMSDERINQFKEKSNSEKVNMHYNLAVVFDKTGNYKNAEAEYLKCIELNPEDPDVYYNLGILYDDKLNENKKAVEYYKKYLDLRPVGEDAANIKRWMLNAEQEERLGPELR